MNVVILGAGTVGTSIADLLCSKSLDVTIVDESRQALDEIEEHLDVRTVLGSACDAVTLFQAGVLSSELCLSVTKHDEINLVGASLSKSMGARKSVARIFNPSYQDTSTFDYRRHFGIDRLLSLEHLTALELAKGIRQRGLYAMENFIRGGIEVQEVAVENDSKAVGVPLHELNLPSGVRIGSISNAKGTRIAGANDKLEANDHVVLIGKHEDLADVKKLFERRPPKRMKVIIAGGGEVGFQLARLLQKGRFSVVLLESDAERCQFLAEKLDGITVVHADVTRRAEMEEARVGKAHVFIAATGRDEDNIVCGVEAKELGSRKIMSVVRRPDYANVLGKLGIDVAVSPREVMAHQVLGMVSAEAMISRSTISEGEAEIWELEVGEGTPITESPLKEIVFSNSFVAAIEREDFVMVPGADDRLQPGDIAVVLVQKDSIERTLKLFTKRK